MFHEPLGMKVEGSDSLSWLFYNDAAPMALRLRTDDGLEQRCAQGAVIVADLLVGSG